MKWGLCSWKFISIFWVLPSDSDVTLFLLGEIGWVLDCFPFLFTGILVASSLNVDRGVLTGSENNSSNFKMLIPLHGVVRGPCSWLATFRQLVSKVFQLVAKKVVTRRSLKSSFYISILIYFARRHWTACHPSMLSVQYRWNTVCSGCHLGTCSSGIESQFKATTLL